MLAVLRPEVYDWGARDAAARVDPQTTEDLMRNVLRIAVLLSVLAGTVAGCASGTARQDPNSGSVVTPEDLQRFPGEPLERVLERKVPGLVVTRTAEGGFALRIRGASSYDGSGSGASPLYILDGLPIQAGPGGAVPDLNPMELASIRVLKGPEAAVYGIDGANGVIVITTKRAAQKDVRRETA